MIQCVLTDLKIGADLQLKTSASGKTYTSALASVYAGKNKDGQSAYVNVRVSFFGKTAERAVNELHKGSMINAIVRVSELSTYVSNQGATRATLECTADTFEKPLGERSTDRAQGQPTANSYAQATQQRTQAPAQDEDLDGLPF